MNIEQIREYTLSLKGVTEDMPFGDDLVTFRIEGKIFLCLRLVAEEAHFAIKLAPERNEELRLTFSHITPAWHWNKKHWSDIYYEHFEDNLVQSWINESYDLIVSKLPKTARGNYLRIQKSTMNDIPQMMKVFAVARKFMRETGNPTQWEDTYPSLEQLEEDICNGDSFVCINGGRIVGTFVLRGGDDPTYEKIYEGEWKNNKPYATIHRIASSGEVKGIFTDAMEFALQHFDTLRIDTHRDNRVMQHIVLKAGFEYCGIIYCWDGGERLAYQFN